MDSQQSWGLAKTKTPAQLNVSSLYSPYYKQANDKMCLQCGERLQLSQGPRKGLCNNEKQDLKSKEDHPVPISDSGCSGVESIEGTL